MKGTETIIRHRASGRDADGDPIPGGADVSIPYCIITPRTSEEEGRGEVILDGQNVFAPPGTDIIPTDEVTARGTRYEVDGVPGDLRTSKGRPKQTWVVLKRRGT